MGRLGSSISEVLIAGAPIPATALLWTDRARVFELADSAICYLEPAELRATVAMLEGVTAEVIARRAFETRLPRVSREAIEAGAVRALALMRRAALDGVGLLWEFSA